MKFHFIEKKLQIDPAVRDYAEKKVGKLDKFFKQDSEATITFSTERGRCRAEVTLNNNGMFYRGSELTHDMYASIDSACAFIERQIRKNKTRLEKKLRDGALEREIKPEYIPLNIVYEDDDVIIINKQAGLVVHPGHGNFEHTLLHGLAYHFEQTHQNIENRFGYLVHRIDKDTTGLMIVAKNEAAQAVLAHQFFEHTIHRRYYALVWGDFEEEEGTIEGNIGRSVNDRRKMTVYPNGDYGKDAITHWKVLERFGYVTLNEYRLETGRTHQIRVHSQYIGHPLFNDAMYGGDVILKGTTFSKYKQFIDNCFKIMPRHALHAKELGFVHPTTGKQMMFTSELPDDMTQVLEKWRVYLKARNLLEE